MYIYSIKKNGTEEFIFRSAMEKQTERIDLWTWGEERRGDGEVWKSNMESYITLCKIGSLWEFAVHLRKFKQGLCINLEGWNGNKDQKGEDICITMADSY